VRLSDATFKVGIRRRGVVVAPATHARLNRIRDHTGHVEPVVVPEGELLKHVVIDSERVYRAKFKE
jgi:hypothetical protein